MLLEDGGGTPPAVEAAGEGKPDESQENSGVLTDGAEKKDGEGTPKPESSGKKSFTQEMVDEIVRNRLERDRKATFKRYGVEDRDGLDSLVGKSQSYDVMRERYEATKVENASLREKMAFMANNINPAREDDVRAYFKGKGIEFNETNLINELATHPEWLNAVEHKGSPQTTIRSLGVEHAPVVRRESEEERQKRIFGV